MNNEQDIEKLFRSSFENFEISPPDDLKRKIDQKIHFRENRSGGKYWLFGSVLALIVSGISLVWLTFSTYHFDKVIPNTSNNHISIPETAQTSDISTQSDQIKSDSSHILSDIENQKADKSFSKQKTLEQAILNESKNIGIFHKKGQKNKINTNFETKSKVRKSKKSASFVNKKSIKREEKLQKNQFDFRGARLNKNNQKTGLFSKEKNRSKSNKSLSQIKNGKDKAIFTPLINVYDNKIKESSEANKNVASGSPVDTKNVVKVVDSSTIVKAIENKTNVIKDIKKENSTKNKLPLLLSLKTGTSLPINTFSNANINRVDESSLFQVQLEGMYSFRNNFGASSGFNYYQQDESYINTVETTKNILNGYEPVITQHDSVFVDTAGNSYTITISDTILNPIYEQMKTSEEQKSSYSIQSFGLPFQLSFTQKLSNKLYLDLMTGGIVSFQKIKFTDNSNPINKDLSMSKIGFKACVKTHLRYQFSQFGVSLNTNFSYDFSSTKFKTVSRNRFLIDLGVGVHYQF